MAEATSTLSLTEREYEQLRQSTETYREELLVRFCGEVGLRAAEIPRLKPTDVRSRGGGGRTRYFLTVHEGNGASRETYVPPRVAHDFWQYVRSNDVGTDEPIVDVSPRRVQMLVREVGERAAERTGHPTLESVTPSVLRRFFARRLLVERGVDPRIVAAIGGWEGVDSLLPPLEELPRDEVIAAFEQVSEAGAGVTRSGRLRSVVEATGRTSATISAVGTRAEVEAAVCEELVADDTYAAAWIAERDPQREGTTVRKQAGTDPDEFDRADDATLLRQSLQTERVLVAPDRPRTGTEPRGLLAAIPIAYGETDYGALLVRATGRGAFDDPERTVLADLGRRIGLAITAVEQRRLLSSDTVLSLTFRYTDPNAILVDLSESLGCTVELDGIAAADADSILCFLTVRDVSGERVLNWVSETEHSGDARLIRSFDDGALLEVAVEGASPLLDLTARGGAVSDLRVTDGVARVVADFAPDVDVRALVDQLNDAFRSLELRGKQEVTSRERTPTAFRESVDERLTEKQQAALRAAYYAGYFEWPRESTAEAIADSMDVSPPTFHNHLRRAQQKLLTVTFEEE